MYRVLLTDDEYIIVDGLSAYIYSRREEIYDIVRAYSVKEALSIMENMRIDIVVTDIEMPATNGIAFHKIIQQKWDKARTIFLTAHNNFDYLFYASRIPNTKFVLKSEGFSTLLKVLDETADDISKELFTRKTLSSDELSYDVKIMASQMSMMHGLLTQKIKNIDNLNEKFAQWLIPLDSMKTIVPILLRCLSGTSTSTAFSLITCMNEKFYNNSRIYPVIISEQDICLLFQQTAETTLPYSCYIRETLDLILPLLEKIVSSSLELMISAEEIGWEDLQDMFRKMQAKATDYESVTESVLCTITKDSDESYFLCQDLNSTTLARIDQFLLAHYSEDISLSDIASQVYLCPSYVSSLYKKHRGMNVMDMLQRVRIEKSEVLLKESNIKIQDVAILSGFRSSKYFISVFKKINKVNPSKYRELYSQI